MGQPAAKEGDQVVGVDTHVVLVPAGPVARRPTTRGATARSRVPQECAKSSGAEPAAPA